MALLREYKYSRRPIIRTPIIRNADYPNAPLSNVEKAHLHFYLDKSLSALDNGPCLSAKAFKFQANLVTMSSMKRKRNEETIKIKLETIDQGYSPGGRRSESGPFKC